MGDISIIARRLKDGHVQYGWSGNGGYYKMVGSRLMAWYESPDKVEYLFHLGETRLIGQPGSENGGYPWIYTHSLTGSPYMLGNTEREIFSKIAFVDYGYFYDTDDRWYYIIPGPFRIKMPLELVANNVDEGDYEFDFRKKIEHEVVEYILQDCYFQDTDFQKYISEYDINQMRHELSKSEFAIHELYEKNPLVYRYFDDWVVIRANEEMDRVTGIILKVKKEKHIETNEW